MATRCAARAAARRWTSLETPRDAHRMFHPASYAAARARYVFADASGDARRASGRDASARDFRGGGSPMGAHPFAAHFARACRGFTASGVSLTSFYDTLGVRPGASADELKRAYRREAMKWHPDRHKEGAAKAAAEKKFKLVSEAYQALSGGGGRQSGGGSSPGQDTGRWRRSGYTAPGGGARDDGGGAGGGAYRRDGAGNYYRHTGTDYSRGDADRVFREMFGDNPFVRDFVKEFTRNAERRTPGGFAGGGFPGGGARGGAPGGVTPEQWAEMVRGVFGAMGSRSAGYGPGGSVSVREEIVTRADGRRVVRTTTTTTTPGGTTTRVEEKVVGAGGKYDYYGNGGGAGVPHSSRVFEGGGNGNAFGGFPFGARTPPPPGSRPGGNAGRAPGADSELATTLGRLGRVAGGIARGFLARFAHIFARQVLSAAFRVLARILFRR